MGSLIVIQGPDRGRRFELPTSKTVVGRDAQCTIRLHDDEASRQHAEILLIESGFQIADLNSSNGTFVNGARVAASALRHGDRIRVGRTEMLLADIAPQPNPSELAGKIDLVGRNEADESSAILRSFRHEEARSVLSHPERLPAGWLRDALTNLAVMYETSQAVSRIGDITQLLEHIMDLVFRSVSADRGCVVLRDPDTGRFRPTAIRFAEGVDAEEKIRLSKTILEYVLRNNEGVLAVDAGNDERFAHSRSVLRLGIREAMCVPLRGRHEMLGALYVDVMSDRKQLLLTGEPSRFSEDHLKLVVAIAHQAGLAVEDNRFHQAMLQAERLAAIGQTFATVSHHIKNVLQGVMSANDVVELGLRDQRLGIVEQGWNLVRRNQQRLYSLVMDMLTYSKDRQPDLQPVDVNSVASEVADLVRSRAAEMNVDLLLESQQSLPVVQADAEAIHRALLNLVGNALDAVSGEECKQVIIRTQHDPERHRVEITVFDTGAGISPENLERIFQVFVSTKGSKGTGLGLPVTKKIMREHGGDVEVSSVLGKGSQFTLWIPIESDEEPANPA